MHALKLYFGILLISVILLSGCAGMDGSEIKGQKAGMDKDDAIPVYEGYIGENPDSVKSRSRLGVWYLKTGRLNEAIAEFETTLKNEPGEPFATYYLGLAYLNKENFEKAIQIWEGYKNMNKPLIEEEIGRQLTLLRNRGKSRQNTRSAINCFRFFYGAWKSGSYGCQDHKS
ncbi:MAG: tetratricopeptide repeat protein [Desulfobacterales bacterium]|nr:tetratricopeptide repeat protein [Desulfobacterales bacterium]